jgi:hypothetical protein
MIMAMTLVLFVTGFALSQQADGEVSGFVYDETGAVIPDVTIELTSPSLMGSRSVVSGPKGFYRIINLPPGAYKIAISKETYESQEIENVGVRIGKASSFNITMKIGEFSNMVVIVYTAPIIDLKSTKNSLNIDGDFLRRLPLSTSRSWSTAMRLAPGVSGGDDFTDVSGFEAVTKVHGMPNEMNYNIDGSSVNTSSYNSVGIDISSEVIDDVEIVSTGFDATKAAGTGGSLSVSTKSGGNDYSGTVAFIYQPESWNWSNVEGGTSKDLSQIAPDFSFGGSIIKDKVWFFSNYNHSTRRDGIARSSSLGTIYADAGLSMPDYKNDSVANNLFGKITAAIGNNQKVVASYVLNDSDKMNGREYVMESAVAHSLNTTARYQLSHEAFWNDNFSTSAYFSFLTSNARSADGDLKAAQTLYPYVTMATPTRVYYDTTRKVLTGGSGYSYKTEQERLEFSVKGNYFLEDMKGPHDIKFGVSMTPRLSFISSNRYPSGGAPFSENMVMSPTSGSFVPYFRYGASVDEFQNNYRVIQTTSAYVNDVWQFNERLSANFGLRLERQTDEFDVFGSTTLNPNLGVTYALDKDGTSSVRFSYVRTVHGFNTSSLTNLTSGGGPGLWYTYDYNLNGNVDLSRNFAEGTPVDLDPDNLFYSGSPLTVDPDYKHPTTDKIQLGYTKVLFNSVTVNASYNYDISRNLAATINDNYDFSTGSLTLKDPSYLRSYFKTNRTWETLHYQSIEFTASKEFSNNWQMLAAYTWQDQTVKGNWQPGSAQSVVYPDSWFEYTNANSIKPHIFRVAASAILPWDISVNANYIYTSGSYLTPATSWTSHFKMDAQIGIPSVIVTPAGTVTNPLMQVTPLRESRSDDKEITEGEHVMNIGIGKDFTIAGNKLSVQFQMFNVFNSDGNLSDNLYMERLLADGTPANDEPVFYNIQSPRAAQLLLRYVF